MQERPVKAVARQGSHGGGVGNDNSGGDDQDDFKQSNHNKQSQDNVQVIKQKTKCRGAIFSC